MEAVEKIIPIDVTLADNFIPFLVADRPASLKIISGINRKKINGRIGIMSHANTTNNFKKLFRKFPNIQETYNYVKIKRDDIIKITDSGVFTKEGCLFPSYYELFDEYEKMETDFGIMIDYLGDLPKTIESAKEAMRIYSEKHWSFKLIGVIQGNNEKEYLECYISLKKLGYEFIAIGGLLKKNNKVPRWVRVKNENFMYKVIETVRKYDPNGWLFALGCYSLDRHYDLSKLGLYGSDSKAWIFKYKKRHNDKEKARLDRYKQIRKYIYEIFT